MYSDGGIKIDSGKGKPLQVSWNRRISDRLFFFIPKSMGFCQPISGL